MKISIILPFLNYTGGIGVAVEYARCLGARGHVVTLYTPVVPYRLGDRLTSVSGLRRWAGDLRLNTMRRTGVSWNGANRRVKLRLVPFIDARFLPAADIVMATAWPTAHSIARLPSSCGARIYLIQHHETWSGAQRHIDASYRLPLGRVVIASWLRTMLAERYGLSVLDTITNGVDLDLFHPIHAQAPMTRPPTVLMQYSQLVWKGLADGFAAWRLIHHAIPTARLVLFGLDPVPDIPLEATFHYAPSPAHLRELYNTSDVFISPSWAEGCQLPPMEAMACGCAVVATNVGGIPDYAVAGWTALVVEPHDVEGMVAAALTLLRNSQVRDAIASAGHQHIQQFTWTRATDRLEAAFRRQIALS